MENKGSQIFGGETLPDREGEILMGENQERFVPDSLQSMGEGALEGLGDLPEVEANEMAPGMERVIAGGGVIAADGEADAHTEKGVDELVERAEKSVDAAKREHNVLKMQEEKIALGRETLEMMRGNGGVQ